MGLPLEQHFFRRLVGIFGTIFIVYIVLLAFLVLVQRKLMYFPDDIRFTPSAAQLDGFTELNYKTPDGHTIHGFFAAPKSPHRMTIVFFQGNAGNLGVRADKIKLWREQGYGVALATYRGFDGNKGEPTEDGFYEDARATINVARDRGVKFADMILYGESLGTGIAVEMAAEMGKANPPGGVVLEVPFTSIPEVGAYRYPFMPIFWTMWDRYESVNKIKNVHAPILILQAGKDRVVPPIFAKKLFDAAEPPKTILTNITADHMGIYSSADIVKGIFNFINEIEKSPPPIVRQDSKPLQAPAPQPPAAVQAPAPVAAPPVQQPEPTQPRQRKRRHAE